MNGRDESAAIVPPQRIVSVPRREVNSIVTTAAENRGLAGLTPPLRWRFEEIARHYLSGLARSTTTGVLPSISRMILVLCIE